MIVFSAEAHGSDVSGSTVKRYRRARVPRYRSLLYSVSRASLIRRRRRPVRTLQGSG